MSEKHGSKDWDVETHVVVLGCTLRGVRSAPKADCSESRLPWVHEAFRGQDGDPRIDPIRSKIGDVNHGLKKKWSST